MSSNNYKIYAATMSSIDSGYVWMQPAPGYSKRAVHKITNTDTKKSIYCEVLKIDKNYIRHYNGLATTSKIARDNYDVVMNEWYRTKLGIEKTKAYVTLDVIKKGCWGGRIMACLDHPQIVVRLSTHLALLSVALGMVGLVLGGLGCISLYPSGTTTDVQFH